MAKRVKDYLEFISKLLASYEQNNDYPKDKIKEDIRRHLIQIAFFAHERMIHLIVTVLFALLTIGSIFFVIATTNISILCLTAMLFVLLIPYIKHYYLLENSVQKMYEQYDRMLEFLDK